jgi:outer membrane receptor protein involved in Fe transport
VEVLRGTPTSLYGNDAVGGVVQLVTRVPRFESNETEVRGEAFASFDTAELGKTARATVDFGNRAFASSFSAEYFKTGNRRTGSGERIGPSGYDSKAARLLLSATPAEDRSWLFDVQYLEQPETPRVDELVPGFGQTEPSSSEFLFAPNRRVFVHGKYTRADGLAGLDWNTDVAWQRVDDDRVTREFEASEQRRESNRSDLYGLTLSGARTTDAGSWIVGVEYYHDRVSSDRVESSVSSTTMTVSAVTVSSWICSVACSSRCNRGFPTARKSGRRQSTGIFSTSLAAGITSAPGFVSAMTMSACRRRRCRARRISTALT